MSDPVYPDYAKTLEQDTVTKLKQYFEALTVPSHLGTPIYNIGRYKGDPTEHPIVEFLVGSPFDESWSHERDKEGAEIAGACLVSRWTYRYTIGVKFFMTKSRERQPEALTKARAFLQWVHYNSEKATVSNLNLTQSDYGETPFLMTVTALKEREGGGPPNSYLLRATLYLEQKVSRRITT